MDLTYDTVTTMSRERVLREITKFYLENGVWPDSLSMTLNQYIDLCMACDGVQLIDGIFNVRKIIIDGKEVTR